MNASQFSRAFKQTYDLTFQEFLLRYRVRASREQLQSPRAKIAEVAYNVGFSDPSYFTRVFKRFIGMSPSEYGSATPDPNTEDAANHSSGDSLSSSSQIVRRLIVQLVQAINL